MEFLTSAKSFRILFHYSRNGFCLRPKALPLLGLLNARSDQSTTDGESEGLESGEWRVNNNIYFSGRFCRHLLSSTDMLIALFDRINILEI